MKTITNRLAHITMVAAVLAAGFTAQGSEAAPREVRVVQLPPVVVTAKRVQVVQLGRVVITARRLAPAPTMLAQQPAPARI